jgi:hypothetical protein
MRNVSVSNLLNRPRFASMRRKSERVRSAFHAAVIVGALVLPLAVFIPGAAHADTLKEVTTKGSMLIIDGFDPIEVTYTPDGKFTAMGGQVTGAWRIAGETLCTTTNLQPVETCALYPGDKKSGDTFDLVTDQGVVQIRIK